MTDHKRITAEEARRLREAATEGPWMLDGYRVFVNRTEGFEVADCGSSNSPDDAGGNAALIAAAHDLAYTVEALQAERDEARAQVAALREALRGVTKEGCSLPFLAWSAAKDTLSALSAAAAAWRAVVEATAAEVALWAAARAWDDEHATTHPDSRPDVAEWLQARAALRGEGG